MRFPVLLKCFWRKIGSYFPRVVLWSVVKPFDQIFPVAIVVLPSAEYFLHVPDLFRWIDQWFLDLVLDNWEIATLLVWLQE